MRLSDLRAGDTAVVCDLLTTGSMRHRLLDIGLVKHTVVTCLGAGPMGDPSAYRIRGAVVALRAEDASGVRVRLCKGREQNGTD